MSAHNTSPEGTPTSAPLAEMVARLFHDTYERLAPFYGYETRRESAVAWEDVPEQNRLLMIETCRYVLSHLPHNDGADGA